MASPDDRRYLASHEWHKLEDGLITIGISRFAVDELTDVTYLDIPDPTATLAKGDRFGEIESVKATSELYVGIAGTIVAVNPAVRDNPAIINEDPYGKGWLIKLKPDNAADLNALLSAAHYDQSHGG
jgi:glycine cleavage system H protein